MQSLIKGITTISCIILAVSIGCQKKNDPIPGTTNSTGFDSQRPALLTNLGNNIIIPNYKLLNSSVNALDSSIAVFNSNPDSTTLTNLQGVFKNAYEKWQLCSSIEFGPADPLNLTVTLNTFPTDTIQINSNISAGSYNNLSAVANLAAQGFPALDYLLFGTGKNVTSILSKYTSDSKASNRKQYLAAVSAVIKTDVNKVVTSWLPTGGNYIQTFINASGTDAGSSVGQLINSLDYDFEILKNDKIGIPAGIQSMGTLFPKKVEGYYSGISSQLALLQLKTLQSIYLGNGTAPSDTLGFDDYLTQIGAQYNGGSLNTAIKAQFTSAITALAALPDPLSATVQSNTSGVTAAYGELQKLLVLLKTDMPSAMGVLITYDDNDGD